MTLHVILTLVALFALTIAISLLKAKSRIQAIRSRAVRPDYWKKHNGELVSQVLELLASELECDPHQLYPTDPIRWVTFDDSLTDNAGIEELVKEISLRLSAKLFWDPNWHTLADLINGCDAQIKRKSGECH